MRIWTNSELDAVGTATELGHAGRAKYARYGHTCVVPMIAGTAAQTTL